MAITNLPVQLTSFIGRERELAEVEQLVSTSRLVTLTGAGGCGKTRLAIRVANSIGDKFADGVWLVELVPLREPEFVPQSVVQALGLRLTPDQPQLEALQNFVRSRQLLIILDNCEHLQAACAQLAQQLLTHAPELHILATSREPLSIAGERIYPLSGMGWPVLDREAVGDRHNPPDLQGLMGYDAVRLFVERARDLSPNFTLTSENAFAIAEACQRLEGLPLALELASARANVLTVQEIAARLDDRFAFLTAGQRTGLEPRHRTLRATIDWSYELLTAEEQYLLRRLSVFAAGCTLDTAEAVCSGEGVGEGRTLDLLTSLVGKSLIIAETTGRAQARYRLLETIREYALEKLDEAGEAARVRDRHLDLFLARAEEAAPRLMDAYQQLWVNWLEGEHDNIRAALAWSLESGRIEAGLRIVMAVGKFWEIRSNVPEGMAWFERLLAQADERIPLIVRANAFTYASFAAMALDKISACMVYGREAAALAEAAGDEGDPVLIFALSGLASGARAAGDFQTAFNIEERVLRSVRDSSGDLGMPLLTQGDIAIQLGYYDIARACLDEGLALAREAGDAGRSAYAYNCQGDLARCEGNYIEAQSAYEKSETLLRELGAQHYLASILRNHGRTCLQWRDVERAHALFSESLAIHQAQQHTAGMTECLIGFASIAILDGLLAAGIRLLAAATAIGKPRGPYVWPVKRMEYEEYLELARARLTEAEFQAEKVAGQAMSLEQAIEYAQNLPLIPRTAPASGEKSDDLTRREHEVARLIAQGKSNREIAEALVLSTRTVEKHVANILSKLGLTGRTQIVRWAIEHGMMQASN